MTSQRWQDLDRLFHSALERPPEERVAFLAEACGTDEVRREVEALVAAHEQSGEFLDAPAFEIAGSKLTLEGKSPLVDRILSHYKILGTLGAGGMGEVYLAQDTRLGRKIALKLLPPEFTIDADRVQRFEQEARAASALSHPNVCVIHEIGDTNGRRFITMEYIEGITLRQQLAQKRLTLMEALDVAAQIAAALAAAHAAGIVHRDIKPENVMLRDDGLVKVLDFGLAKLTQQTIETDTEALTRSMVKTGSGMIMGTVAYMSPEQARGLAVDSRTDIWSLGVLLYEMVAGRAPFAGATPSDMLVSILERDPPAISRDALEVPAELERIVRKALRKDREERYRTAEDFLVDLKSLQHELAIETEVARYKQSAPSSRSALTAINREAITSRFSPLWLTRSRNGILTALVGVLIVAGLVSALFLRKGSTPAPQTEIKSLAVLPFKPINVANRDEIYELGIADSVILKISSSRNLIVRQLHAVRNYVELDRDLIEIGKEQNVDFVLASNYQIANGKIKVTSQLLDVATSKVEDTFTVEKDSTDLFSAQDAIAGDIGSKLIARFGGANNGDEPKRGTTSEEAYRLYLQGMYLVEKGDKAGTIRSIELFDQAISLDPNYAAAWAGKGHAHCAYSHMGDNPPAVEYEIARPALERALELDGNLPEAYAVLGIFNTDFRWNFAEGEKHFLRAIELNPSSDFAYRWYGNRLVRYGRTEEAIAAMKTAIDNNPTNIFHHRIYGWVLYMARHYDEAIKELERVVEMDPGSPSTYDNLWLAYHAKGDHAGAFEWFMKYHERAQTSSELITQLNAAYQNSGWQGVLESHRGVTLGKVKKGEFSPRYYRIAVLSALVGDKDEALESLNEAFKYRSANITFLKTDPALDSLRGDPRFQDLVQRAGF